MGKIRVKTLGDEALEQEQVDKAKKRREEKRAKKAHVKGVGLKGGQQITAMEGVELKTETEGEAIEETGEKEAKKTRKAKVRIRSKRYQQALALIDKTKHYSLTEALELLKKTAQVKFDPTVEVHINLNPANLAKDKKSLSGTVVLPHGTGKKRVIAIADEALIDRVSSGTIDFDILVTHPSLMPKLAKVARVLGPKGLMPNPKNGTVTPNPEKRVKELSGGELTWKTEPEQPVIHQAVGKASFSVDHLAENVTGLIKSINVQKILKLTLSSTMGPGIKVDLKLL